MKQIIGTVLLLFFLSSPVFAQQKAKPCTPSKELCAKMLRFGKEAYIRGKYLDAKEFFRKAVQADPSSMKAWQFYDLAVIFGLAEKVEKNNKLIMPDRSTRQEMTSPSATSPELTSPAQAPGDNQEEEMIIEDDEGC